MRANETPKDYILGLLQADLKDIESMRATYLEGRGAFHMLVEDKDEDSIISDSKDACKKKDKRNGWTTRYVLENWD